jgi:hypothetical protein
MLRSGGCTHLKHNILKTRGLGGWPVYSGCGRGRGNAGHIKDKIPDLPEEHVGGPPVQILRVIFVAVDQAESRESSGSFQGGYIVRIPN